MHLPFLLGIIKYLNINSSLILIFKYLKYTSEKQAENFAGVSPAFSPDTVNDFCKNASERFIRFYTAKGFKNGWIRI